MDFRVDSFGKLPTSLGQGVTLIAIMSQANVWGNSPWWGSMFES